jgi:hypothetical protein
MALANREERRRNFRADLYSLKEKGYLTAEIVDHIAKAHNQYHLDLMEEAVQTEGKVNVAKAQIPTSVTLPSKTKAISPATKPHRVKKTLSPEEVRERNITWSLNIGVIFLLIGGLFVATSNWETMSGYMKSSAIATVAFLFFGLSYISKKVLNIDKTAFAFTVLGGLFLPIFILSLGWFGLLGPYLSINGEGKYFLGTLGSIFPAIVYVSFARALKSRLFVWFSFVSFMIGIAFLLAAFNLSADVFYLGIMTVNAIVIAIYHWMKKQQHLVLFTNELVFFSQLNLVLSTLFMLFLYDNHILYSFNLLLTAVIYLSMMFVTGKKEFHFVFSGMIVYGAYQLIENSFLEIVGPIFYALVAVGFLFVPQLLKDTFPLQKAFQYTSAVISGLAFIYISFEGMIFKFGEPSIVLLLAYFIIAGNFIYLANDKRTILFNYLSSIFLASGLYELIALLNESLLDLNFALLLFLVGFLLFIMFGIMSTTKYIDVIKDSTRNVAAVIMILGIFIAEGLGEWWELALMFLLFAVALFLLGKVEKRTFFQRVSDWSIPVTGGLAIASLGEEISLSSNFYQEQLGLTVDFAAGSLVILLSSYGWKKVGEKLLSISSLYVSMAFYTISISFSLAIPVDLVALSPLVLLVGVGMYSLFYAYTGMTWVPFIISGTTLITYFLAWDALFGYTSVEYLKFTGGALLLFVIAILFNKKECNLFRGFAWTAHCFYPLALLFTLLVYSDHAAVSFAVAVAAYAVSVHHVTKEWKIKAFLYGAFTSLFFAFLTGFVQIYSEYQNHYAFMLTSITIVIYWLLTTPGFKQRTVYFLVPFSILGSASFILVYPFGWIEFTATLGYAVGVLFFLNRIKWDVISFIPLLLVFIATVEYTLLSKTHEIYDLPLTAVLGILLTIIGKIVYKQLYVLWENGYVRQFDSFSLAAFLFFAYMYTFEPLTIWTVPLPGILISINLWLQGYRVEPKWSFLMPIFAGVYLLQPYYATIAWLDLPQLWEREIFVLPLVIVVIFLQLATKGRFEQLIHQLEWAVLIIVSLLLVQDGLQSSTIYDAIILGTLSLISMITGMYIKVKSYFFVGAGVLLLNLLLQTRPFWGNMPWWAYLLVAGSILIGIASYHEWHKQKTARGENTLISFIKEKIVYKLKEWK